MTEWEHVTYAESDAKPGKEYAIERLEDGAFRCACESFRFAKGAVGTAYKTCKHIAAWQTSGGAVNVPVFRQAVRQQSAPVHGTKVAGETFVFRRAISFGKELH